MNNNKLKKKYDELVAEIESAQMFDGRNKGVDVYFCKKCGKRFYTRYKDKGVTPFTIKCRHCEHGTMMHDQTISEQVANVMALEVHNWVRPTFKQLQKLSDGAQEHVLNGGLMLEDELEKDKSIVKEKFCQVHEILDSLINEEASFLFIGNEGNHFAISGQPTEIMSQITFAMCRYPIVEEIIKTCASHFDVINKKYGEEARNMTMDHLIEKVSEE